MNFPSMDQSDNYLPYYVTSPPDGLMRKPMLTFDEFIVYDVDVFKTQLMKSESVRVKVSSAAKNMRLTSDKRKEPCTYSFSLSDNEQLDDSFNLPTRVAKKDLFSLYWPNNRISTYLKNRSKIFSCYQEGYITGYYMTYGGLTEWIQLISGSIDIILVKPTKSNLERFTATDPFDPSDRFQYEAGTSCEFQLKPGHYLQIPAGFISLRRAGKDAFTISGQFLHSDYIDFQLDIFEMDVKESGYKYMSDRDTEIRAMYWIAAARLLSTNSGKDILKKMNWQTLISYKDRLVVWRNYAKSPIHANHLFTPAGIQVGKILNDFVRLINSIRKGQGGLNKSSNSINVTSTQASTNDDSD